MSIRNNQKSSQLKKIVKQAGGKAAVGRPRNEKATRDVLNAAMDLGMELGFDALTVEGVAARTGVGKATIYRRWRNVWAIIADAVLADADQIAPLQQGPPPGKACMRPCFWQHIIFAGSADKSCGR